MREKLNIVILRMWKFQHIYFTTESTFALDWVKNVSLHSLVSNHSRQNLSYDP